MAPDSSGEVMQSVRTAQLQLATLCDFVMEIRKRQSRWGAIPRSAWAYMQRTGEEGKSQIRAWITGYHVEIDVILTFDVDRHRHMDEWRDAQETAQELLTSLDQLIAELGEPNHAPELRQLIRSDELNYPVPG